MSLNSLWASSAFFLSSSSAFYMAFSSSTSWSSRASNFAHSASNKAIRYLVAVRTCSAIRAWRIPYAIELSYKRWYDDSYDLNSFLTRTRRKPRSAQFKVICRMTSSKHYRNSSSRIGHTPTSRACPYSSRLSSSSFKLRTSTLVAGVGETYRTHNFPFSVNSLGGRIEFK